MNFKRGKDPIETMGIGQLKVFKYTLEKLKKEPAIEQMFVQKGSMILSHDPETPPPSKILNITVNMDRSEFDRVDDLLIKYLPPKFFVRMEVNKEMGRGMMMSDYLGDVVSNTYNVLIAKLVYENLNFEGRKDPKKSMMVGILSRDISGYTKEELKEYIFSVLPVLFDDPKSIISDRPHQYLKPVASKKISNFFHERGLWNKIDSPFEHINNYIQKNY